MRRRSRCVSVLVSIALGFLAAPVSEAQALAPLVVTCGQAVSQSFRLANNLDCSGDGFVIDGGVNITIDLGGHILRSDGSGTGVAFTSTSHDVTLRNGTIADFDTSIRLTNSDNNVLSHLAMVKATTDLVSLRGDGNRFVRNTFARGGQVFINDAASGSADSNVIDHNTFADASLKVSGGDLNVVSNNKFFGPETTSNAIALVEATANGATQNTVSGNTVIGTQAAGILVSGDASDGNRITGNVSKANGLTGSEDGISVTDADDIVIAGNTVSGNNDNGIDLSGSATSPVIKNNVVTGNAGIGINVASTVAGAKMTSNTVNNNGEGGIVAAGVNAVADGNATNFNGYLNGLTSNTDFGIRLSGSTPTGSANHANGNDVPNNTIQCSPTSLCVPPAHPVDAPFLTKCNNAAPKSFTLNNPLDCSGTPGLAPATDGVTIDLSTMFVSGGSDAAIAFATPRSNITIKHGSLVASNAGIIGQVRNSSFGGIVASAMASSGFALSAGSKKNVFARVASVGNTDHGIDLENADSNVFTRIRTAANGNTGIDLQSVGGQTSDANVITGLFSSGNAADGVAFLDGNNNLIQHSKLIGNGDNGVFIDGETNGATKNTVTHSTLSANVGDGAILFGDGLANPPGLGSARNRIIGNTIATNGGDGIGIEPDPDSIRNVLAANSVTANGGSGVKINGPGHQTVINTNSVNDNAVDGIFDNDGANGPVVGNVANHNGFFSDGANPVDDNVGLGIRVVVGAQGCGNVARQNDDPAQAFPAKLLKPC